MKSRIIRILIYNILFAGLGAFLLERLGITDISSAMILLLLGLIVIDAFIEKRRISDYGFKRPQKKDLRLAIMIFALFFPFSMISRVLIPKFDFTYAQQLGLSYSTFFNFLLFSVPLSIIVEELGTRSLLQSKLNQSFGSRFAIYATAINFTLLHLNWAYSLGLFDLLAIISTVFFYSIFLVLLFDYTKNIFATMTVHLMLNITSTFQILFHIYNQFSFEAILWSVWGIVFVATLPFAISFLKKAFYGSKGKINGAYQKIMLIIFSLLPILMIIIFNSIL